LHTNNDKRHLVKAHHKRERKNVIEIHQTCDAIENIDNWTFDAPLGACYFE